MKKQYDYTRCLLESKQDNITNIMNRNKEVLNDYNFTNALNKIQSAINKMQSLPKSGKISIRTPYIHTIYENDGVSSLLYDELDKQLIRILHDDFGYTASIENFDGAFFGIYYLVLDLNK